MCPFIQVWFKENLTVTVYLIVTNVKIQILPFVFPICFLLKYLWEASEKLVKCIVSCNQLGVTLRVAPTLLGKIIAHTLSTKFINWLTDWCNEILLGLKLIER